MPSAIRPSSPSGASNCSYRFRDAPSNGPTRVRAEPVTKVDQQVESGHTQPLEHIDLQMRNQGLGFDSERASVWIE